MANSEVLTCRKESEGVRSKNEIRTWDPIGTQHPPRGCAGLKPMIAISLAGYREVSFQFPFPFQYLLC